MRPVDYLSSSALPLRWQTLAGLHRLITLPIAAAEAYILRDDRVVKNKNDITLDQHRLHGEGVIRDTGLRKYLAIHPI